MKVVISLLLAVLFYIVIVICYKIMGKREISQLSIFDFVMNLIIADIAATGIVQEDYWLDSLGGVLVIVLLQVIMAKIQVRFPKSRVKIDGEPSLVIKNGRIDYEELTKLRIQLDELIMLLRQNNVASVEEVQYALIEPNGKVSIYEKKLPTKVFPLPLIVSGELKPYALSSLGKDEAWLLNELEKNQFGKIEKIKYLFFEENKLTIHTKNELVKLKLQS